MKTLHSRVPFIFARNAVVVAALTLSAPLWAQQDTPREATPPQSEPPARSAPFRQLLQQEEGRRTAMEKVIPEINVPAGGTLAKFAEFLSEETGANIVLEESLKGLELPALKLRNVSITSALEAVRINSKQGISVQYSEDRGAGALLVTVSPSRRGEVRKPAKICRVFRLLLNGPGLTTIADKPVDDEKTRKALVEKVEHISEAARQACRALATANGRTKTDADYPAIEVHPPTHLLMVIGEETDVDLVAQIISGVGGIPMSNAKPELPARGENRSALGR